MSLNFGLNFKLTIIFALSLKLIIKIKKWLNKL